MDVRSHDMTLVSQDNNVKFTPMKSASMRQSRLALASASVLRQTATRMLKAYDLVRSLREEGVTVIGGFHTPVEKECLRMMPGSMPGSGCRGLALIS